MEQINKASPWRQALSSASSTKVMLGYMVGLFALSSIPGAPIPDAIITPALLGWIHPSVQNLLHVPLFAGLAWLCYRTCRPWIREERLLALITFLLTISYGVFDEWHQSHIPGRCASLSDLGLDATGALLAIGFLRRRVRREGCQRPPLQRAVTQETATGEEVPTDKSLVPGVT